MNIWSEPSKVPFNSMCKVEPQSSGTLCFLGIQVNKIGLLLDCERLKIISSSRLKVLMVI